MLSITITEQHFRFFDEKTEEFFYVDVKKTELQLEHSLVSLRKWEQKWHIRFIEREEEKSNKTPEQTIDYIRCMTLNKNIDPDVYNFIPKEELQKIEDYIRDPMTATTFSKDPNDEINRAKKSREGISAELIYYWMIMLGIPFECEKWHLNTLLTLIRVINVKNKKPKKTDAQALARSRREENLRRRAMLHTKG